MNEFGDPVTVPMLSMDQLLLPKGVWTPGEEAAELLRQAVADLRVKAFYEEPADCAKYVEGEPPAELGDVVSGAACVQAFAVPAKGAELDPDFAQELASRFEAESVPMSWGRAQRSWCCGTMMVAEHICTTTPATTTVKAFQPGWSMRLGTGYGNCRRT